MRLKNLVPAQHRLLRTLTRRISNRLETHFTDLPGADGPTIGVELRERGKSVVIVLPETILLDAGTDVAGSEVLRVRLKARRDRMLFRVRPRPLPKHIGAMVSPFGFDRRFRPGGPRRR